MLCTLVLVVAKRSYPFHLFSVSGPLALRRTTSPGVVFFLFLFFRPLLFGSTPLGPHFACRSPVPPVVGTSRSARDNETPPSVRFSLPPFRFIPKVWSNHGRTGTLPFGGLFNLLRSGMVSEDSLMADPRRLSLAPGFLFFTYLCFGYFSDKSGPVPPSEGIRPTHDFFSVCYISSDPLLALPYRFFSSSFSFVLFPSPLVLTMTFRDCPSVETFYFPFHTFLGIGHRRSVALIAIFSFFDPFPVSFVRPPEMFHP